MRGACFVWPLLPAPWPLLWGEGMGRHRGTSSGGGRCYLHVHLHVHLLAQTSGGARGQAAGTSCSRRGRQCIYLCIYLLRCQEGAAVLQLVPAVRCTCIQVCSAHACEGMCMRGHVHASACAL